MKYIEITVQYEGKEDIVRNFYPRDINFGTECLTKGFVKKALEEKGEFIELHFDDGLMLIKKENLIFIDISVLEESEREESTPNQ